jgi:hypothetical protein
MARKKHIRRLCIVAALAVVVCLGGLGYYFFLKGPKNWGVVEQGAIYRSGMMKPWKVRGVLADHQIKVVVSMCSREPDNPKDNALEDAASELGVEIKRFPMGGNGLPPESSPNLHVEAVKAICDARAAGKPVLVQCAAGAQRTGGVVAAYQLLVRGKSPDEVFAQMRRHRHDPDDNPELVPFLNEHMPEWAAQLVELGVIDTVPEKITISTGKASEP